MASQGNQRKMKKKIHKIKQIVRIFKERTRKNIKLIQEKQKKITFAKRNKPS